MIDRDLVTRKMLLITGDLNALTPVAAKPLEDYLGSETDEIVAERRLERLIGRMIDVNYHLITEAGQPPPPDYYDSFVQLGRLGILPVALASAIAACAGLRNRIVHEYDEIDPARVHEALRVALREVPEYLAHVHRYLERALPG
jgi:uncharacterized protein YutE (UPF0331/DUF86 family)